MDTNDIEETSPPPTWFGYSDPAGLTEEGKQLLRHLADAARQGTWGEVFSVLDRNPDLVNVSRPGGRSAFTPLHQAAYHGATPAAQELVRRGAWLALRTTDGETAAEVAMRRGHRELAALLAPPTRWAVPTESLRAMEFYLHALIRIRADELVSKAGLRLPPVEPLTGMQSPRLWFPIPGMYGGFSLCLLRGGEHAVLQADSWCRMASGSEERHLITARGVQQLDFYSGASAPN